MMENNYSIGGEQSGHIIFSRYSATGDGILTSLMIMEACVDQKATLCDLAKEMKVYPQLLRNVRVSDKKTALGERKGKKQPLRQPQRHLVMTDVSWYVRVVQSR